LPPAAAQCSSREKAAAGRLDLRLTPWTSSTSRLLVGERLHRRVDAEELLRVANADTCFPAAPRTSLD
jgi:hypothetical protein